MSKDQWSEVSAANVRTWDRKEPIQGFYTKHEKDVGPNGSNMYHLDVKGEDIGVWGSSVLDSRFERIRIGCEVRIEPLGKITSPKNNRQYNDFKVYFRGDPLPPPPTEEDWTQGLEENG